MTEKKLTLSPAQITEQLQTVLNRTASAENYQLESETLNTFRLIERIETGLPADESRLTNYYLLFNAWIRWLADWNNYSLNLLHRRRLIGQLNKQLGVGRFTLEIYPYSSKLYSFSLNAGRPVLQLHEALDLMNESDCVQLAHCLRAHRWTDLRRLIANYQERTPQCKEISLHFQNIKTNPVHKDQPHGKYYDLEEVFNNCNRRLFGGKMPRPRVLHWSAKVNHSTMGSYNINEDILMVNKGLDRGDVPAYVLDFVMYHELLHKALGIRNSGTRRMAHTREFREFEKRHPDYERAEAFIQKNAKRL